MPRLPVLSAVLAIAALNMACQGPHPSGPVPPPLVPAAIAPAQEVRPYQGSGESGEASVAVASPAPTPAASAPPSPQPISIDAAAPASIGPVATMIPFNVLRVDNAFEFAIPDFDPVTGFDLGLDLGSNLDIVLLDFKTKTVLDVNGINTRAIEFRPLITGDGRYIYYMTRKTGDFDIWRYDMTTRRNETLSFLNTEDNEYSQAISLDGNYLVYLQGPLLGKQRLFRQSVKTGERSGYGGYIRLSESLRAIRNVTCNVDATKVAFAANTPHDADIFLMDFNTGVEETPAYVNTIFNETFPWLSPDGNLLLFVSDRAGSPDIYFLDRRNGRLDNLPFANSKAIDTFPFFIGGTQIMFLSNRGGRFRLYRYDWVTGVLDTLSWIDANHQLPPLLP